MKSFYKGAKRIILIIILFVPCLILAQDTKRIGVIGAYQFLDYQSFDIGVSSNSKVGWPKTKIESRYESILRAQFFRDKRLNNEGKATGIRGDFYWKTKYFGAGFSSRFVFNDPVNVYDFGPTVKIGYKYLWVEFVAYIDSPLLPEKYNGRTGFENGVYNINLTFSYPIIKLKR